MKKLFLLGTMLGMASAAFAFGGVLGGGHKSTTYKSGLNAIGVHFGGEAPASIGTSCPEHSSMQGDSPECVCDSGYEMTDSACKPIWPSTCAANGLYWCVETQTCVADKPACMAFCPEDRLCGKGDNKVCCGQGNVCVDGNKCCFKNHEEDEGMCCDAPSSGFSTDSWDCCNEENTPYVTYADSENYVETACCSNTNTVIDIENGSALCCEAGATKYVSYYYGYNGEAIDVSYGCCNGTPYRSYEEEDGPRLWYEQSCCPIGTSPITKSIGHGETTSVCCSSEEKVTCSDTEGSPDCDRWECCTNGVVIEERGLPICAPMCEDGVVAQHISNDIEIMEIPYTCKCQNNSHLYCDRWGKWDEGACEESKCCPADKTLTTYEYASACCATNEVAYCSLKSWGYKCRETGCCNGALSTFDDVSACCSEDSIPYCAERFDQRYENKCRQAACCNGTVIEEGSYRKADLCCNINQRPYCLEKKDGICSVYRCCTVGEILLGSTSNSADSCCVFYCPQIDANGQCIETRKACNYGGELEPYCAVRDEYGNCRESGDCHTGGIVFPGEGENGADICVYNWT